MFNCPVLTQPTTNSQLKTLTFTQKSYKNHNATEGHTIPHTHTYAHWDAGHAPQVPAQAATQRGGAETP